MEKQKGFTLIELIFAIALLTIVISVIIDLGVLDLIKYVFTLYGE